MEWLFAQVTTFDILVGLVFLIFLVRGIWVGFIRQLSFIIAMVAGFVVAGRFSEGFYRLMLPFVHNPKVTFLLAYVLLFIIMYLLVLFIGIGLNKVMSISLLSWFDRTMGGLFGLVKALFLTTVFFMVLAGSLAGSNRFLKEAFTYPVFYRSSQVILNIIKDNQLRERFLPREPAILLPDEEKGGAAQPGGPAPVEPAGEQEQATGRGEKAEEKNVVDPAPGGGTGGIPL